MDFNPHSHKGSDHGYRRKLIEQSISIHTPTRGVTSRVIRFITRPCISIHTPTRGVTISGASASLILSNFNPHSHKGSDGGSRAEWYEHVKFQSTLPQGEWHCPAPIVIACSSISIHTPTRGVTARRTNIIRRGVISMLTSHFFPTHTLLLAKTKGFKVFC